MRHRFSTAILLVVLAGTMRAECPPAYIISAGLERDRPEARFTKLDVVRVSDGSSLRSLALRERPGTSTVLQWVISIEDANALKQLRNAHGTNNLRLRWSGTGAPCDVGFAIAGDEEDPPVNNLEGRQIGGAGTDLTPCRATGAEWTATLDAQHGAGNYAIVILTDEGETCYTSDQIDRQSEGDPIYVGVFTLPGTVWSSPRYAPCALQTSTPRYNAPASGTTVFRVLSGRQTEGRVVAPATPPSPQRCFNENVEISVVGTPTKGAQRTVKYNLRQHPRHHFTLQLGAYDASKFQHSFGTRTVDGKSRIFDKGPSGQGIQYYAGVVLYGAPHYLTTLRPGERLYPGRDLVNDQSLWDRISLILGAGLENPADHFVAGIGFEVFNGVSVTGTYSRRRFKTLAEGLKVGDEFSGAPADIPMRDFWDSEMALGLSLDLGYALRFLQR